jgi:bifunctional DNase/RNase
VALIEMELSGVRVELPTNQPIALLREKGGERYLPIWIGPSEAASIAMALQGVATPRPMTHDLVKTILDDLSVRVEQIVVTELRESTFYAVITLERGGEQLEVSARPSDAMALAVRMSVPIFAAEEVLEEAAILIPGEEDEEVEKFREFLDNVTPDLPPSASAPRNQP